MSDTYKLLDCGNFQKLEQVGPFRFVRPSPGAVWAPTLSQSEWKDVDATFIRKSDGKGFWKFQNKNLPEKWQISLNGVELEMQKTSFGHLGVFVEQSDNWVEFREMIQPQAKQNSDYKVLNLFAYTGGASIAAALGGAQVTHVDASKTSNSWARKNAELNGLADHPMRWLTDDVKAFIDREVRRENKYQGIILDPPTYGRGSKNQVWKIESDMVPLLKNLQKLMADDFHFISLSSHSPGYTPIALKNLLSIICPEKSGIYTCREMTIPYPHGELPSGATCLFSTQ